MKILSIDTAHGVCSVALSEDGVVISAKTDSEPSRQAERLFLTIDIMLKECGLTYANLNAIAANVGPGSFTGVRIGLAAARGVALAAGIPIIGVNGFEALIYAARKQSIKENILVVFDAKRGQVFTQFSTNDSFEEELMLNCSDLPSSLNKKDHFVVVGDGAVLVEDFLQSANISYSIIEKIILPDASMIALKAFDKINNGNYDKNPAPLYIRPPDAKLPKVSN